MKVFFLESQDSLNNNLDVKGYAKFAHKHVASVTSKKIGVKPSEI